MLMSDPALTLFSWGYRGWGNATDKLVEAVDAVEKSRGRGPPIFVDVRAKRGGRAEGFKENTFRDFVGPDRYRWMKGLGNRTVLERGGPQGRLVDATEASGLLDLGVETNAQNRRVIYYCACAIPQSGCHRHWIAPELFKLARKRGMAVTVVEWPGFESAPKEHPVIGVEPKVLTEILRGTKKNVPLPDGMPGTELLGLPCLTIVKLNSGKDQTLMVSGPAEMRASAWQLPKLGTAGDLDLEAAKTQVPRALKRMMLMPRSVG